MLVKIEGAGGEQERKESNRGEGDGGGGREIKRKRGTGKVSFSNEKVRWRDAGRGRQFQNVTTIITYHRVYVNRVSKYTDMLEEERSYVFYRFEPSIE